MARIRLPGGMITAAQLATLADISSSYGSGTLELTARGNVQVRGITDITAVAEAIGAAGLLPSATHERVRNVVASPLSGRVGGRADVRAWVGELDAAIRAEPRLAELGGRFWFSLDDGRGDVSGLGADAGAHVLDDGVALLLAGRDTGVRVSGVSDVIEALAGVAGRFVEIRGKAWRVTELAETVGVVARRRTGCRVPAAHHGAGGLDTPGRRPRHPGRCGAAGGLARTRCGVSGRDRGPAGDHAVAFGAGVRSRRRGGRRRTPSAGAVGPGVRRELSVAGRQCLHRQSRLRAFGRRRSNVPVFARSFLSATHATLSTCMV